MDKRNLYISDGWINAGLLVNSPEPFVVALGGRGIGKTYGILKHLYCNEVPFIYMRRTQTQLDAVTIQPLNPYNQIAADLGEHITAEKLSKHTAGFTGPSSGPTGSSSGIRSLLPSGSLCRRSPQSGPCPLKSMRSFSLTR